jgi:hypothetical protein
MRDLFRFTKGYLRSGVWSSDDFGAVGGHKPVQSVICVHTSLEKDKSMNSNIK